MFIISLVLFQLIVFAVLIIMLRRIMGRNIVSATRHIEELSADYANKEKEITRQLEEAKQQSQATIAGAQEEAQAQRAQTIKEAQAEKEKILNQARLKGEEIIRQADKSRQLIVEEMQERIDAQAVDKACELIQQALPEKFKQEVHTRWVKELIAGGFGELKQLQVQPGIRQIKVTCAFSLTDEERGSLVKKLKEALGPDITVTEEVDSKIVAGLIIAIDSLVLDGSFRNRINEKARRV